MEAVRLMIGSCNGSPIPVIVRTSNIAKANQAVHYLFNDADLSFRPCKEFMDPSACLEEVEATGFFFLHFFEHQSGKELKLSRLAGFSCHQESVLQMCV